MSDIQLQKFSERFREFIESNGHNPNSFAKAIGHDRSDSIRNFAAGRGYPTSRILIEIAENFSDINWNWLIAGKGNMHNLKSKNEIEDVTNQSPDTPNQEIVLRALNHAESEIETLKKLISMLEAENASLKGGRSSAQTGT